MTDLETAYAAHDSGEPIPRKLFNSLAESGGEGWALHFEPWPEDGRKGYRLKPKRPRFLIDSSWSHEDVLKNPRVKKQKVMTHSQVRDVLEDMGIKVDYQDYLREYWQQTEFPGRYIPRVVPKFLSMDSTRIAKLVVEGMGGGRILVKIIAEDGQSVQSRTLAQTMAALTHLVMNTPGLELVFEGEPVTIDMLRDPGEQIQSVKKARRM